jgi:hypothetical protein
MLYLYSLMQTPFLLVIGSDIPVPASPRELISDSVKRTAIAHLFYFYPILCEIASIPGKVPTSWISPTELSKEGHDASPSKLNGTTVGKQEGTSTRNAAIQFDARKLASEILKEIGKEMGVSQ